MVGCSALQREQKCAREEMKESKRRSFLFPRPAALRLGAPLCSGWVLRGRPGGRSGGGAGRGPRPTGHSRSSRSGLCV